MKETVRRFKSWFFTTGSGQGPAVIRIGFGAIYLFMLWDVYPVKDMLMGHDGIFGTQFEQYFNFWHPFALLYRFDLPWQLEIWFWCSVLVSCLLAAGLFTRTVFFLTYYSMILFQTRGTFFIYGADKVMFVCGLWMLFLDMGRWGSADAWLRKKRGIVEQPEIQLWPLRAIQIQIALVYLYSGLCKFATEPWRDGSAVYYALNVRLFGFWEGVDLTEYKLILMFLAYGTLFIECFFPAFVFYNKMTRNFILSAAVMMHVGIDLFMHIRFFSLVMYWGMLSYFEPGEWQRFWQKIVGAFIKQGRKDRKNQKTGIVYGGANGVREVRREPCLMLTSPEGAG